MTTPSTGISALQSILDCQPPTDGPNKKVEAFHLELKRHNFRPLQKKMDTLSITAALGRWPDLKKTVKDQLTNDIIKRWQNFDTEQIEEPPQIPEQDAAPSKSIDPIEDAKDADLAQQTPTSTTPAVKTAVSSTAPKRDWFDLITDFVAIFFKPLYDSE